MNNEPDERGNVLMMEHLLIRDVETDEILLSKRPYHKEVKENDE